MVGVLNSAKTPILPVIYLIKTWALKLNGRQGEVMVISLGRLWRGKN